METIAHILQSSTTVTSHGERYTKIVDLSGGLFLAIKHGGLAACAGPCDLCRPGAAQATARRFIRRDPVNEFLIGLQMGCSAFDNYFIAAFVGGLLVAAVVIGVAWMIRRKH